MRCTKAQRIFIGYSPWLNQYPWRVAPQQSPLPFPDKRDKTKFEIVYLQPVLELGRLHEEFTQASCGPCASQNPAFNAVLAANTAKATSLKYQTSWPGVDPMNAQNPTDVQTRVNYYSVNGVPDAIMDGNVY